MGGCNSSSDKASVPVADLQSIFGNVTTAPVDPILGTTLLYNADTDPRKVNLGVGAYRTEDGKPFVLGVIKQAEEDMLRELGVSLNKEYSTIDGPPELKTLTQKLVFGDDCTAISDGRIASVQALSGTGALRVAAEFVKHQLASNAQEIWISDPTWGNHTAVFAKGGLAVKSYPYYKAETKGFDFENMIASLKSIMPGAIVLLHACAHNPTGVDPSEEQWKEIAAVMKEQQLVPLLDSAYQGYASGDVKKDAFAIRLFLSMGFEMMVCQSFAKNMGLYGERIGMLHVVCRTADLAKAVLSQLKMVVRPMYSSPPKHGAELVVRVLGNEARCEAWMRELSGMAERIQEVRSLLRTGLEKKETPGQWNHITDQIGMFSYTGLSEAMCECLITEHHIYLLKSGRISLAGINKGNVQYVVDCFDEVVRKCS